MTNRMKITEIAHSLYAAHGDKAELEAARRENESKQSGDSGEAETWRAIRGAIRGIRGANQS